jgi:hypothetical protein
MNVKAQGLLNAAKYVEDTFGRDALGDVLRRCSPAVRQTYVSSIALNWHPLEELTEFVDVAESLLGNGGGRMAVEIGAAGARANMKGLLLRIALYWGKPEYMMQRVVGAWRQFNDEGMMHLRRMGGSDAVIEVTDIAKPNATLCHILTGWCTEIAIGLGLRLVNTVHTECRTLGDKRCLWEVRGKLDAMGVGPRPGK